MGCPPPTIIDQERAYLKALGKAKRFRVVGDRLEILDNAGDATLVFIKQVALPGNPIDLAGTQWRLLAEGDWEEDAPSVTLVFLDDYRAAGVAACRDYFATYGGSRGADWLSVDVDGWILLPVVFRRDSQAGRSLHNRPFASARLLCRQG